MLDHLGCGRLARIGYIDTCAERIYRYTKAADALSVFCFHCIHNDPVNKYNLFIIKIPASNFFLIS